MTERLNDCTLKLSNIEMIDRQNDQMSSSTNYTNTFKYKNQTSNFMQHASKKIGNNKLVKIIILNSGLRVHTS